MNPWEVMLPETEFHRHFSAQDRGGRGSGVEGRYVRSRWRQQSKCSPFVTWSLMAATCTTLHSPRRSLFLFFSGFPLIRLVDRVAALSSAQAFPVILIECKECRQFSFPFLSVCVCVRCVCASDRISLHCLAGPILCVCVCVCACVCALFAIPSPPPVPRLLATCLVPRFVTLMLLLFPACFACSFSLTHV